VGRILLLLIMIFSSSALVFGIHYLQQVNDMKGKEEVAAVPPLYKAFMLQAREVSGTDELPGDQAAHEPSEGQAL
jgi:hypothetical protein